MLDNKESFKDYLQKEKKYSLHTVTAYSNDLSDFEAFLKQDFDQDSLEDVNYSQIRSWIVSLVDAGISNTSVNRKISSLKSFYKFLLKIKRIQVSPLLKHKALKTPKKLQIPFSEKELDNVLNYIVYPEGFEGMRDKLIIDLFYTTGIRRAELIGLKVANVDLSKGVLKVLGKRNKERILPMLPVIQEQLRLYLSERAGLEEIKDGSFSFLR